jgi:Flp pilus assembly protein CpaB
VKRSNRLVILVGVLLAVLAFVGIVILLNSKGPGVGGPGASPSTVAVLVAREQIEIGQEVTPEMVEVKQVEESAAEGSRFSDPSQVGGRPALVTVPAGSQVNAQTFGQQGAVCISCQLTGGEKAIPVLLDSITGVDFLIQPGDHVDVIVSVQLPTTLAVPGESIRTVKVVLQNKRVLFVSARNVATIPQATPAPGASAPPASAQPVAPDSVVVVIAGTNQDAEVLRYAQRDATELQGSGVSAVIALTIRSVDDTKTEKTSGITIVQLIKDFGLKIPNPKKLPSVSESPSP